MQDVKDNERGRRRSRDGQDRGSRGRGSNRSKPEIIQSSSVFSMGPANKMNTGEDIRNEDFCCT